MVTTDVMEWYSCDVAVEDPIARNDLPAETSKSRPPRLPSCTCTESRILPGTNGELVVCWPITDCLEHDLPLEASRVVDDLAWA